jgi:alpha-tubulin suppressor-like RCC1 family protein
MGDNLYGQTGEKEIDTTFNFRRLEMEVKFKKISAGFQHSLLLGEDGKVYGCGKSDKMQLGPTYIAAIRETIKEAGTGPLDLNLRNLDSQIVDIGAGKYHSVFLSENGSVYTLGVNRFGQLGDSNINIQITDVPVRMEFINPNEQIKEIAIGDNHNLMLSKDGTLYGNGDNTFGQVDGELDNALYYQCAPKRVILPKSDEIVKMFAKNTRSAVILSNNDAYFWGGNAFVPGYPLAHMPKYEGINIYNKEEGVPEKCQIEDIGLGYLHDILLVNNI